MSVFKGHPVFTVRLIVRLQNGLSLPYLLFVCGVSCADEARGVALGRARAWWRGRVSGCSVEQTLRVG